MRRAAYVPSLAVVTAGLRMRSTAVAGRYVLLDQVGAGASGTVWRAWDKRERRYVAAKLLGRDGVVADPLHDPLLLRFVREQGLRVRHPHVLSPTGWAAEDDRVVFTMQLVRGGTLEQLLAEHGRLPAAYVAVLLAQLLDALAAVHAAGVVHRDVKPANLLLEPTGDGRPHLLLGDFGVATRPADDLRLTTGPGWVGTDGYVAPEARIGAPPDARHDLYAAGVVATLALTGRRAGPPTGPLAPLLAGLTAEDPNRRPATADTALALLRATGLPDHAPWTAGQWTAGPRWPSVPARVPEPATQRGWPPWSRISTGCLLAAGGCDLASLVLLLG